MRTLSIDIETYSPTDLKSSGVFAYAADPDFEILLFAYTWDDGEVFIVDMASGEELPGAILQALTDPKTLKTAFNAAFEMACISAWFRIELDPAQWECTMVRSAMFGLAMSLKAVAEILKLDEQKMSVGTTLIRYFSVPCKPTRSNGERTRNLPHHDRDKWELFKAYCIQDVATERAVRNRLLSYKITDKERALWVIDQRINQKGVLADVELIQSALEIDREYRERLSAEATDLTGLSNPNSVAQLKAWLEDMMDEDIESLNKAAIKDMLEATECPDVTRMLELRQEMSKTSVKKYAAMANALGVDNRIRGLLQYYGANRTGRWAGRLVQIQNLPQNHLEDLDLARSLVKQGDADLLEMCYGNVPAVLSELIRTAFIAGEGKTFVVADFSAIEARVIAWLADEMWVLDVFKTHGKIYEATAANMFHVPLEEVTKGSPLRQKGKVATLALGYQGGVNALTAMDSGKSIPEEEKPGLVERWRAANPHIVRLWKEVERAALKAVREATTVKIRHGVTFIGGGGMLYVELPSGRRLSYARPRLTTNQWGSDSLTYEGMDQVKKTWGRVPTYGGKLTENIVQAIARDCLAESLMQVDAAGYEIVMHVHDELVVEVPIGEQEETLEEICRIMGRELSWAKGLPLRADGYITPYYKKE